ncbi:MAG: hypothetical protein OQK46_03065 [Gammaproteobacteria bacterium]|nr:hypothetical protein [Gammaproteobacteria bacterium]
MRLSSTSCVLANDEAPTNSKIDVIKKRLIFKISSTYMPAD